ncbi:hypothetical protein A2U01_0051885, partial [Trifolium medium]|nr:hypothetical protein [Trifolium medium]
EHFFYDGFPVISEADDEEVILNFLEDFMRTIGIVVPRSMVPPAPNTDLYKPRKRKRTAKTSEEQKPKKKEMKKEEVTTSEKQKDDTAGEEKVVKEKVVVEEAKKDKKRKTSGIKIDEGRSKMRHNKGNKKDDSSTESDEETLAQRLKQKTSEAYAKEM